MKRFATATLAFVLGCGTYASSLPDQAAAATAATVRHALDGTVLDESPAADCVIRVHLSREQRSHDAYVPTVPPELRFDDDGHLLFAIDHEEYAAIRRSWFFYGSGNRLTRIVRHTDRMVLPIGVAVACMEPPCARPPQNDRDETDERYAYDSRGRLARVLRRTVHFDHRNGVAKTIAPPPRPPPAEPESICDIDPSACPGPVVLVGGSFHPFATRTLTVTLEYADLGATRPKTAHFSREQQWHRADGTWEDVGRTDSSSPVEDVPARRPNGVTVTHVYDPLGRLTRSRSVRQSDGSVDEVEYTPEPACRAHQRAPLDPRGETFSTDPLNEAIGPH